MTKAQKALTLYETYNKFDGYSAARIAKAEGIDKQMLSYIRTLLKDCTTEEYNLVKEAVLKNEKFCFDNGEVTGSLESAALLCNKGYKVIGYGDPSMVLYLLECDQKIKIGVAKSISNRIASMQTGNPYKINLLQEFRIPSEAEARSIEKELHTMYRSKNLSGEWFSLSDKEVVSIVEHMEAYIK